MVRLASALALLVALGVAARASELPRHLGMYTPTGTSLAMLDSKLDVAIRGPLVEATITQTFRNDSDRAVEATYIFPLPFDAAVSAMAIDYGARKIHASIAKRDEAQRRYEDAVAAGVAAALLDEERPDVFTQTVSAIPPHGTVAVTLRFDCTARFDAGAWQLVLPLVVAPRYVPGSASGRATTGTGHAPDTQRAPDASRVTPNSGPNAGGATTVSLAFSDAVDDVASPTHELAKQGDRYTLVDAHSDHDAIIRWKEKEHSVGWVEQDDDSGYAAVLVEAPAAAPRKTGARILLVLDRAATIRGDADAVEHPFVRALFAALGGLDTVGVTGSVHQVFRGPELVARVVEQAWSTPPEPFDLTKVLAATRAHGAAVVLVTDGLVADDRATIAAAKQVGGPIHVIGVGAAPNRSLLEAIAGATGGTLRYAVVGDDLAALAKNALADATSPPPALAVTWGTLAARDVVPAQLPRLGAGQAALVVARVDRAKPANARARGDVFGFASIATTRPPEGATTPHGALARRWARARLDELVAGGDRNAIAAHALRYGLVSPATSMVAIGEEVVVEGGVKHSVAVPVSLPAGMQWQTVKQALVVEGTIAKPADNEHEKRDDHREALKKPPSKDKAEKKGKVAGVTVDQKTQPAKTGGGDDDDGEDEADERVHRKARPVVANPAPAPAPTREAPPPDVATATDGSATGAVAPTPEAPREESEDLVASEPIVERRTWHLSVSASIGAVRERGVTSVLAADTLRFESGRRTLLGVEGSLWLVGNNGLQVQGALLATVARRGIARWLEAGGGLGLHLGDGLGPAAELELRARLIRHVQLYLRYDGALLLHDTSRDGQNAGTFGVLGRF